MRRQAICGEPMRRYEKPGRPCPDYLTCGRRPGHPGRHISAEALRSRRQDQAPTGSPVLAAAIRQAREQAAMSRPALAAVVGVSATAVQWWEQGRRTPNEESWIQLELALGPLGIAREADPKPAAREQSDAA